MAKDTGANFDFSGGPVTGVTASADQGGMVFDLTGVEENKGFEVLPKGTYGAVVDEFEYGRSKADNPMITIKYSITDAEYENRAVYDYWVLQGNGSEFGLAKFKKFLLRICPEIPLASVNPQSLSDTGAAIGKACKIVLGIQTQKQGEYKGEKRNQVKDVLADDAGSFMNMG